MKENKFICIRCYNKTKRPQLINIKRYSIHLNCTKCDSINTVHFLSDMKINWGIAFYYLVYGVGGKNAWSYIVSDSGELRDSKNQTLMRIYDSQC